MSEVALARPTIAVDAKIEDSKHFVLRFKRDLQKLTTPTTPEKFLVDQFIANFESVSMFTFVPASPTANAVATLTLRFKTAWPKEDVYLQIQVGNEPALDPFLWFEKAACGTGRECYPASFTEASFYQKKLKELIDLWPNGLLSSVVLTSTAKYDAGRVRTKEPLTEFGENPMRTPKPKAVFEIRYGEERRRFTFCGESTVVGWKAAGIDVGKNPNPSCFDGPTQPPGPNGENGIVTLVEKL